MKLIKKANSCKYISDFIVNESIITSYTPKAGDVGIFEVLELGSLNAIQDFNGRNCYIFEGDHIMVVFGNRYASKQFEAHVPKGYQEEYDLVGKGGMAGNVISMHVRLEDIGPTKIKLIGYATKNDKVLNAIYYHRKAISFEPEKMNSFKTILSVGSSMDSGKTTTAAFLCRGLKNSGKKTAYIKLTGTVFNKDKMLCFDCGADYVSDFSELGFPSTYLCSLDTILDIYANLLAEVAKQQPDYLVIEIADGLFQKETSELIHHVPFTQTIDHVILSSEDSLGAATGFHILSQIFDNKLLALSGCFTASPLLVNEVEEQMNFPVLTLEKMVDPDILKPLLKEKREAHFIAV